MAKNLEGYRGIVGFDVVPVGNPADLLQYVTGNTIYDSIRILGLRLSELGWTPENAGNISLRYQPHHTEFFITASGSHFSDLQSEDIIAIPGIDIVVGKKVLPIGANFEVRGEPRSILFMDALAEQGLLDDVQKGMGTRLDYKRVREEKRLCDKQHNLRLRGSDLMRQFDVSEAQLSSEFIEELRLTHKLCDEDVAALKTARACENIGGYELLMDSIRMQDRIVTEAGLGLLPLVKYLGSRGIIKPRVEYVGSKKPSSETLLHGFIYATRWDDNNINAILHCHAPRITRKPPRRMPVTRTPQDKIGYGTMELAIEAFEALGEDSCVVLRGHGPVAVSEAWDMQTPGGFVRGDFNYVLNEAFGVLKDAYRKVK